MSVQLGGLLGVLGGIIFAITGLYYGRRKANKERGLDEVNDHIWKNARSYSWYVTLVAIYIFLFLSVFGVALSLAVVLASLLFIHLFSWALVGIILSSSIYDKASKSIIIFIISFILVFLFSLFIINLIGKVSLFNHS